MKYIKTFEKLQLNNQSQLNTALLKYAKVKESLELLRGLIIKGANVNCKDIVGRTPLMIASAAGFYRAVELFIKKGADVNYVDSIGNTALLYFVSKRFGISYKKCLDLFIENNIDLSHENSRGFDVFSVASFNAEKLTNYIKEKYPEMYDEYLMKKDANKYNL